MVFLESEMDGDGGKMRSARQKCRVTLVGVAVVRGSSGGGGDLGGGCMQLEKTCTQSPKSNHRVIANRQGPVWGALHILCEVNMIMRNRKQHSDPYTWVGGSNVPIAAIRNRSRPYYIH